MAGATAAAEPPLDGNGPYSVDTQTSVSITAGGQTLSTDLFAPQGAPAGPIIVGAHGLDGHKEELTGWGNHFASHGFAVAIPQFNGTDQNAAPGNATFEIGLMDWIAAQSQASGTFFSGRADGSRRGMFGHSMGGLVLFLAASQDPRIQVAVGLDPVDVNSMAADAVPHMEGFPMVLRASYLSVCNSATPAEPAVIAAFPDSQLVLTVANTMHCDPQDPEQASCVVACTALLEPPWTCSANPAALLTFRRYATAIARYKLLCDPDARVNLDGAAAQADIDAGIVFAYETKDIGQPGGCLDGGAITTPGRDAGTEDQDAGAASGVADSGPASTDDAGGSEGADAGTGESLDGGSNPVDGGSPAMPDAGAGGLADAGTTSQGDAGSASAPIAGCRCSGGDDFSSLLLLLIAFRSRGSGRARPRVLGWKPAR